MNECRETVQTTGDNNPGVDMCFIIPNHVWAKSDL